MICSCAIVTRLLFSLRTDSSKFFSFMLVSSLFSPNFFPSSPEACSQTAFCVETGIIIGDGDRKPWDPRTPMIWDNFSIFRTNWAIAEDIFPRTCRGFSRGCCHVAWSSIESAWREGISTGTLICSFMLDLSYLKRWVFQGEVFFFFFFRVKLICEFRKQCSIINKTSFGSFKLFLFTRGSLQKSL